MHQENLYPMKQKSKLDVGLPDYCSESEYLKKLTESLKYIELEFKPDLVFYLAGADIFKEDVLGNIQVSKKGVRKRDEIVKEFIEKNNAKSIVLLSGGYARNFQDTVLIHYETARVFGGVS
jgi:acetoin utilization deacetylase AcuC-like enzyme